MTGGWGDADSAARITGVIRTRDTLFAMRLGDWDIPEPADNPASYEVLLDEVIGLMSPIGEALRGAGVSDPAVMERCLAMCAGVMLARYWRDVRPDVMKHDRVTIPKDIADKHGLDRVLMRKALMRDEERGCDGDARDGSCDCANTPNTGMRVVLPAFREAMYELVARTGALLDMRGVKPDVIPGDLRKTMRRLRLRGVTDLRLIKRSGYDTLTRRPIPNVFDRVFDGLRAR